MQPLDCIFWSLNFKQLASKRLWYILKLFLHFPVVAKCIYDKIWSGNLRENILEQFSFFLNIPFLFCSFSRKLSVWEQAQFSPSLDTWQFWWYSAEIWRAAESGFGLKCYCGCSYQWLTCCWEKEEDGHLGVNYVFCLWNEIIAS